MNIEDKMKVFSEILDQKGALKVSGIHEENHKPHPFTVGDEHTKAANNNGDGVLTEEILEEYACAHSGCKLKYSEHEADRTLFLQLKRDVTHSEAHGELKKIKGKLKELAIKQVAFVDTEEGYKFLKD